MYTVSQKTSHLVLSIYLLSINRFSKLFHWHTQWKISNKVISEYPTTPQWRRYTTLRNMHVRKTNNNSQQVYVLVNERHFRPKSRWMISTMLHCVRPVIRDIWRVELTVCFWLAWLCRLTSSFTLVTFFSVHACFGLPLLIAPMVGASCFPNIFSEVSMQFFAFAVYLRKFRHYSPWTVFLPYFEQI